MKTLFVTDLDGTLLQNDGTLSPFAKKAINTLMEAEIGFTIATARSVKSVQKIFEDIHLDLPIIEFNGIDHPAYEHITNYLYRNNISYFVSSFDGERDNLYYESVTNKGENWYAADRIENKDPRLRNIADIHAIGGEEIICLTIIDTYDRLVLEYQKLLARDDIEVHFQENPYSPGWFWLTVHSSGATKAKAIKALIELRGMESHQITVYGDNTNDIKMMKIADSAIAVSNAKPEVKAVSDKVIRSNEEDGVIKHILEETGL